MELGIKTRASAAARLLLAVWCGLALGACGNGDDSTSMVPSTADAGSGAKAADAGADGPSGDVSSPGPDADATVPVDAGVPAATFASTPIDFGGVACSATGMQTFTVQNSGGGTLAVTASTTGSAFAVDPTSLTLLAGDTGTLTLTVAVPGSSTAGTALAGSLNLFTNDPGHVSVTVALSATPTGATVVLSPATAAFPSTGPGATATLALTVTNTGNGPATVSIGAPGAPEFAIAGDAVAASLAGGQSKNATATFAPTATSSATPGTTAKVTVSGTTCGSSVSTIALSGAVAHGTLAGWPSAPVDFGPADCGGTPPADQTVVLTNTGSVAAHVLSVVVAGASGFGTDLQSGSTIPAGGTLTGHLHAPAIPTPSPLTPVTATVTVTTDADTTAHAITLTEEPRGAVLAFDTSPTPGFGSFGMAAVLQAVPQNFNVTNTGNSDASVTLTASSSGGIGPAQPFTVSDPSFTIGPKGTQTDSAIFVPTGPGPATGLIIVTAAGALCSPLPASVPLSGSGIGAGPAVQPQSLDFGGLCGGPAAAPQSFTVSNNGNANMTWSMSDLQGAGKGFYTLAAVPPPGLLGPGALSRVTVSPAPLASPLANPTSTPYTAQVTITTDAPFDDPHVVQIQETPLGDQLSVSVGNLRFGQFPIDKSTVARTFTVTNNANAGSPAASVSLALGGAAAAAYSVTPATIANLAPSGGVSSPEALVFSPTSPVPSLATVSFSSGDSLCTPLPSPIVLSGTGTQGKVSVSPTTLTFGTDPNDAAGLVNCGSAGLAQTFSVTNTGNQQFQITGLSLGQAANSPYALSGSATTLPFLVPIGASTTITVTPKAIPATVADPNDPSPFTDTLTVTTDATLDTPHAVALVMQARGAVIADTPLPTAWDFGTLGNGLIGKFSSTITNTGNAGASITFHGLQNPTVFGLQNDPTLVVADGVTDLVGQFSPPQTNQVWTDEGTLVVTPAQAFCAPLPSAWNNPTVHLSGSSIAGSLPVTVSGGLAFPSTECGSGAPAAQSITLTNTTNIAYEFTAHLASGAFYTLQNPSTGDASAGIIPGNGVIVLGVTPQTVTPGPNAVAGPAPYADDLVVQFQTQPPSGVTIPISWTLDGAMLSLPEGAGPNHDASGNPFYAADTGSGLELPIDNTGTATASVQFGVQPAGAFSFSPAPPIALQPGIRALPRLASAASDAVCPALTVGSATFLYSGPVCRPIPLAQVSVESCAGAF